LRFSDARLPSQYDTCNWLEESPKYQQWREKPNDEVLLLSGHPGSGKSTIMRSAVEKAKREKDTVVLYYFFYRRGISELQYSLTGMYRTLLYQVLKQSATSCTELLREYKEKHCDDKDWQPPFRGLLEKALSRLVRDDQTFIFIDAMDESIDPDTDEEIRRLFNGLLAAKRTRRLRIHISHRPACANAFETSRDYFTQISVQEANRKDLESYIEHRLKDRDFDTEMVKTKLAEKARGIFLWARLVEVFQQVKKGNASQIESTIDKVPQDLNKLFSGLIQSVAQGDEREETVKLFFWVCFAQQPLTVCELQHALALDPEEDKNSIEKYRADIKDLRKRIRYLSRGLIEIAELPRRLLEPVRLIHQSVFDFLVNSRFSELGVESPVIGRGHYCNSRCLIHYKRNVYCALTNSGSFEFKSVRSLYPLITHEWVFHAEEVERAGISQSDLPGRFRWPDLEFLEQCCSALQRNKKVYAWDLILYENLSPYEDSYFPNLLQLFAVRGWNSALNAALENPPDGKVKTPVNLLLGPGTFYCKSFELSRYMQNIKTTEILPDFIETNAIDPGII
jgi:energy-coupling factor transporter ATP-binding protein EcfA2